MWKRLIKQAAIWFIIIGAISWGVAAATGNSIPTFIEAKQINYGTYTTTLYVFSVKDYLKNIETLTSKIPLNRFFYDPPTFPAIKWSNILSSIPNLFIWWINFMMWWLNIVIFAPLKLLLQPIMIYLSILGIDLQKYNIIEFIYYLYGLTPKEITIPYI